MVKFISITELATLLNLVNPKTKKTSNHILRYWEKEFKEIKPKKFNNRRYYSLKQVETIKMIKFLLKNKGMTIYGVRKLLDKNINKLDDKDSISLKGDYYKSKFKSKSKKLLEKITKIRKYAKKNSS